jgi:hypothetical protein
MQSPTTTNSSTSSASSQPIVGEPSSQGHSAQSAASNTDLAGSQSHSAQSAASSTDLAGQGHKPNSQKTS